MAFLHPQRRITKDWLYEDHLTTETIRFARTNQLGSRKQQPTTIDSVSLGPTPTDHDPLCFAQSNRPRSLLCPASSNRPQTLLSRENNKHLVSRPSTCQQPPHIETVNRPADTLFRDHKHTNTIVPTPPTDFFSATANRPHDFLSVQPQRINYDFSVANSHQPTQITHSFELTLSVANDNQPLLHCV